MTYNCFILLMSDIFMFFISFSIAIVKTEKSFDFYSHDFNKVHIKNPAMNLL